MKIIRSSREMQDWSRSQRRAGCVIGFVPTMGYLHEGHLSLVDLARSRSGATVLSIFVNPKQFGPNEDLDRYPRDFERDEKLCRDAGVDVVFYPSASEMYPPDYSTYVVEEALGEGLLCGASRPGHFRGVTTVVAKLFNIVLPDVCVLGEKDAQQLRVLRRMTRDLNFPIEIVPGPTMREADGLAMSSRNKFLTPAERSEAVALSRSLVAVRAAFAAGERDASRLREVIMKELDQAPSGAIDYVAIVDDDTMQPLEKINGKALIALAVKFPHARLIDNVTLTPG